MEVARNEDAEEKGMRIAGQQTRKIGTDCKVRDTARACCRLVKPKAELDTPVPASPPAAVGRAGARSFASPYCAKFFTSVAAPVWLILPVS